MVLEYLTANSLSKYPFRDDMSMRTVDNAFTLLDSYILETVISSKIGNLESVFLKYLDIAPTEVTFTFALTRTGESTVEVELIIDISNVGEKVLFTADNQYCSIKLIMGQPLVDWILDGNYETYT